MKQMLLAILVWPFGIIAGYSQNVGIGMTNPNGRLQFKNEIYNRILVLNESVNNEHNFFGFGINEFTLRYQVADPGQSHVFFAGDAQLASGSKELFRIKGNGNVGIGQSSPNAPLQFSNAQAARKIVLHEFQNNDFQFYGFGFTNGMLRYQTASLADDHVFLAASGPANSNEIMRIKGNGNVGIGVPDAVGRLHFANEINNRMLVLNESIRNDHNYFGFGINNFTLRYQVADPFQSHVFFAGNSQHATGSNELFRIRGNGHVGIGNSNPNAPLQFATDTRNRKIVLWSATDNDHQFYGFGVNGFTLRYQTPSNTDDHVFFAGTGAGTSNELFRIKGNGALAVGGNTGQPGEALISNGAGTPASWRALGQQFPVYVGSPGTLRLPSSGFTINASTVNVPSRGGVRGLLWIRLEARVVNCLVGGCPSRMICEIAINGTEIYRIHKVFILYPDLLNGEECWFGPIPITTVAGNNAFTFRLSGNGAGIDLALTGHVMLMGE